MILIRYRFFYEFGAILKKKKRNFNESTTQRVEIESKNNLTLSIRFEIEKTNKQWTLISIPRCFKWNFNKSTTQRVEIESKNNLTSSIRFEI